MKIRIKNKNPELIQELDEDEISYLDDAMKIPISEMPFSNIFGGAHVPWHTYNIINLTLSVNFLWIFMTIY